MVCNAKTGDMHNYVIFNFFSDKHEIEKRYYLLKLLLSTIYTLLPYTLLIWMYIFQHVNGLTTTMRDLLTTCLHPEN